MTAQVNENELIKKWTVFDTPHQTLKFSQYPTSEYLQAMRLAMKEHNKEIEKIKNNPEAPTFENTIVALEESGDMLSRIQYCFYNLLSAETNDEMDNIAGEISPEETEHTNVIYQDATLFARVKAIYDKKETLNLTIEEKKLLEETYESFENMGATLPADKQKEFSELSKQLSALTLQFQQNVLKSTNEYKLKVADVAHLSGLPQAILDAAKEEAKKDTFEGYVFT